MLVRSWVVLIILFLSSRFYRKRIALFSFRDYFFSEAQRSSKDLSWLINFCITFSHPLLYGVHILELGFWQGELSLCRVLLAEGEVLWASLQHSHFNCCLQPLPNQDMASWCLGDRVPVHQGVHKARLISRRNSTKFYEEGFTKFVCLSACSENCIPFSSRLLPVSVWMKPGADLPLNSKQQSLGI